MMTAPVVEQRGERVLGRREARSAGFHSIQTRNCQNAEDDRDREQLRPGGLPDRAGPATASAASGTSSASRPDGERRARQRPWRRTSSLSRSVIVAASVGDLGRVEAPRPLDVDGVLLDDPAGPAREQDDAVAEAHRLAHVVGHEDHASGRSRARAARARRAGRRGSWRRARRTARPSGARRRPARARARARRAGACRRRARAGACSPKPPRCTSSRSSSAFGAPLGAWRPCASFSGELDVAARGEPREQRRFLEHQRGAVASPTSTVPASGWSRPATMLSSVLLPQPDAPSRQTNSPGATSRVTLSSACDGVALGAEDLRDVVDARRRDASDPRPPGWSRTPANRCCEACASQLRLSESSARFAAFRALLRNDRS